MFFDVFFLDGVVVFKVLMGVGKMMCVVLVLVECVEG